MPPPKLYAINGVVKICLYFMASLLLGAWCAPLTYQAAKAFSEISASKPTNSILSEVGKFCRAERFLTFHLMSVGFCALVFLLPLLDSLKKKPMDTTPNSAAWRKRWMQVVDLIYPPLCEICDVRLEGGRSLCEECDADLPRLKAPFCENCGEEFEGKINDAFECPNCARLKFTFRFARPAMSRDERTLGMIHRLKYGRKIHLAAELGRLAAGAFTDPRLQNALEEKWPLVPVPLHFRRFQHRHFNQAAEIAGGVAAQCGLPILHALERIRHTSHQTILTRSQRLENLKGAFQLTSAGQVAITQGMHGVILVDDVLTTGATVNECAKVLQKAGIAEVVVITVMRG